MGVARRLKCVYQGLLAEEGRAVANTKSTQRVNDLVEEIREVVMDYQVCMSSCLFPLCLTFVADFVTTRCL